MNFINLPCEDLLLWNKFREINRNGRLYATVLANSDIWKGSKVETFFLSKADGSESGGLYSKYGSNSWNTSGQYCFKEIIRLRERMVEVKSAGAQLFNDIVYELRVDLAFEEHRYF